MNYVDFSVNKDGRCSYHLTLPCFSDGEKFYEAARMNRFYSSVMDKLYYVSESVCQSENGRIRCTCSYRVTEEDNTVEVELMLSMKHSGKKAVRKSIRHTWKDGYAVSLSVDGRF